MTKTTKIAFLGFGNMAKAMLEGLAGITGNELHAYSPSASSQTSHSYVHKHKNAEVCLAQADVIVVAVKPKVVTEVLQEHAQHFPENALVISVAAGISLAEIIRYLPKHPIIRCMPNTPVAVGLGVIGAITNPLCSPSHRTEFEAIFSVLGNVFWLADENACDALTAISGSGPAFVYAFLEALTKAAEHLGFAADTAEELSIQTAQGALALIDVYGKSPQALREAVTSKGGTTAAGLEVLAQEGLDTILQKTLTAAYQRACALGQESKLSR